jgi:hypothetical protein
MIARLWTARTTPDQAPACAEHLRAQVLPTVRALDGTWTWATTTSAGSAAPPACCYGCLRNQ